jgi:tRNA threonylcarbamoyladenosine biosynthesis protein TsaB
LTPTILAIDTAMAACSAAVWHNNRVAAQRFEEMERGHAERIAPMVREVMDEARLGFDQLDRIAVTVGPGTFTGQRIGLAMARGLGLALDIPVIGVTTLEAIALANVETDATIVVVCDARRDEAYFATFSDRLKPIHAASVLPLDVIAKHLPVGRLRICGTAATDLIAQTGRSNEDRGRGGDLPLAENIAIQALDRPASKIPPEPLYLRPPDAKPQAGLTLNFIRRAGAHEAALIAGLHVACFEEAWDRAAISALMATPGTSAWLAETQGDAKGFALARRAADEVEILSLGIKPSARRRGFARQLVGALVEAHADASAIFIEAAADNGAARALYRSCGFIEAGRRNGYYARINSARQDAIIMRKDLKR